MLTFEMQKAVQTNAGITQKVDCMKVSYWTPWYILFIYIKKTDDSRVNAPSGPCAIDISTCYKMWLNSNKLKRFTTYFRKIVRFVSVWDRIAYVLHSSKFLHGRLML